jgi:hypothetical protein
MQRRDLRSDRLMTPWSRQKENATTGTRPEHGLDSENPGRKYCPTMSGAGTGGTVAQAPRLLFCQSYEFLDGPGWHLGRSGSKRAGLLRWNVPVPQGAGMPR